MTVCDRPCADESEPVGDLHALAVRAELQRLLQAQDPGGHQPLQFLPGAVAHVDELALVGDADDRPGPVGHATRTGRARTWPDLRPKCAATGVSPAYRTESLSRNRSLWVLNSMADTATGTAVTYYAGGRPLVARYSRDIIPACASARITDRIE